VAIVFAVLAGLVVLFVSNRFPVEVVAFGASLTLVATGVLEFPQAVAGFGDPTVLFIASLFVVSHALEVTGVTTWAGQQLAARAGTDRSRLLVLTMALVALLTALISVNGAVAALMPMVVVLAIRLDRRPSQLLMPLAFAAHAGSMLALTGTPVNVLVSDASVNAGTGRFGFFEFTLVGIPLVLGTVAVVVLFGERLLPHRTPDSLPADLSEHARTLGRQYLASHRVYRLVVEPGSAVAGRNLAELGEEAGDRVELVGVQVGGEGLPTRPEVVDEGDVLIVRGAPEDVERHLHGAGLRLHDVPFEASGGGEILSRVRGVAEVVIPPRSAMVGTTVFPGMVTDSGDLVILAVQRAGQDRGPEPTVVAVGDTLLVQGLWDDLDRHVEADPEVLPVHAPSLVRQQAVPMGPRSGRTLAIVAAMVVLLATGVVPAAAAGLLAAGALVLTGVVTMPAAYRAITWTTVVLVGAMIPLSVAMQESGAAQRLADTLVDVVGDAGPHALLLGLFLLTAVLGQLISNTATALVVIPVAISAAAELGVSARPVLMCVTVAAAAALLTPVATPANLMVMGPGAYRFNDYWKLGLPIMVLYGLVAVGLVPLIWHF
jgi:di/tricarboxylate transporter